MYELRLKFAKRARASYISHLDLMRTMQRAFLRAGLGLKYSEGFNPHACMSMLLPLSVGIESRCELMDFSPAPCGEAHALEEIPEMLNRVMPEGIEALECYAGGGKPASLKWLEVSGRLEYDKMPHQDALPFIEELFKGENIPVLRRTKRGEELINLAGAMNGFFAEPAEGALRIRAVLSAYEPVINPALVLEAIAGNIPEAAPDFAGFVRERVLREDMSIFR